MKWQTKAWIITGAAFAVYVVVSAFIYLGYDRDLTAERQKSNQIGQSYATLQDEIAESIKIRQTQAALLQRVNEAHTMRDYVAIWREVNNWHNDQLEKAKGEE